MKKVFKVFVALFVVVIVAVIGLLTLVDPNDYKSEIEEQAQSALKRELNIDGDLVWVIFPTFGIETGQIELKNGAGFTKKNLAKIDHLSVSLRVLPLLSGDVVLGELNLDGLVLNLETNEDGVSNLAGIGGQSTVQAEPNTPDTTEGTTVLPSLSIAGINITNTRLTINDRQQDTDSTLTIKLIELSTFKLGNETDLTVILNIATKEFIGDLNLNAKMTVAKALDHIAFNNLAVKGALNGDNVPAGSMNVDFSSNANITLTPIMANVDNIALDINGMTMNGSASMAIKDKTHVIFDLSANTWDLNPLLPAEKQANTVKSSEPSPDPEPEIEPDLSVLDTLDVNGNITFAGFKAKGINVGRTAINISVLKGVASLAPLSVDLYEGNMTLNATVRHDNGNNDYKLDTVLTGVKIQPLLKDAADINFIDGETQFQLTANGSGLTVSHIKQRLSGEGSFSVTDGAIYGINLAQKLRSVKATLGSDVNEGEKKTDFSALFGKFSIDNGDIDNTSLTMEAPFLRLAGNGTVNLIKELIDYHLKVTLVATSKGQGSKRDLTGIPIPLKVTGDLSAQKFKLDTSGALKEKIDAEKAELKAKTKDKLDKAQEDAKKQAMDKLKNKLKGIL